MQIGQLIRIKQDFKEILNVRLKDELADVFFSKFVPENEWEILKTFSVADYIDQAYPILELDQNGNPKNNRCQSCINAVTDFSKENSASSDLEISMIISAADFISAINSAINMFQKLETMMPQTELEALEQMTDSAYGYAIQACKILDAINGMNEDCYRECKISFDALVAAFRTNNLNNQDEEEEEFFLDISTAELSGYKERLNSEPRALIPTWVNTAYYNMSAEVNAQVLTVENQNIRCKTFKANDDEILIFDCIEVDTDSGLNQLELKAQLSSAYTQFQQNPKLKRAATIIAAKSTAMFGTITSNHFVVLVIERNIVDATYLAYILDSKTNFRYYLSSPTIGVLLEQLLKNTFKSGIIFERINFGHQSINDHVKCGYFAIKVIQTLIRDLTPIRINKGNFVTPDNHIGTAENWLTQEDIVKINEYIDSGWNQNPVSTIVVPPIIRDDAHAQPAYEALESANEPQIPAIANPVNDLVEEAVVQQAEETVEVVQEAVVQEEPEEVKPKVGLFSYLLYPVIFIFEAVKFLVVAIYNVMSRLISGKSNSHDHIVKEESQTTQAPLPTPENTRSCLQTWLPCFTHARDRSNASARNIDAQAHGNLPPAPGFVPLHRPPSSPM